MVKIGTAGLFFAAALTFLVTMLLVEYVAPPGARGGGLQIVNYLVLVLLVVSFGLLLVACSRVGRRDQIGPATLAELRSLAWTARYFILSLVALGLCFGLCGLGSKFDAPQTFSFLHDSEAWLGIASLFASGLFLLKAFASLISVIVYRWRNRSVAG